VERQTPDQLFKNRSMALREKVYAILAEHPNEPSTKRIMRIGERSTVEPLRDALYSTWERQKYYFYFPGIERSVEKEFEDYLGNRWTVETVEDYRQLAAVLGTMAEAVQPCPVEEEKPKQVIVETSALSENELMAKLRKVQAFLIKATSAWFYLSLPFLIFGRVVKSHKGLAWGLLILTLAVVGGWGSYRISVYAKAQTPWLGAVAGFGATATAIGQLVTQIRK